MACFGNGFSRLSQRRTLVLRIIFDIFCIAIVGAASLAIKLKAKPYRRGFFCDDQSIQHPVLNDTISNTLAATVGLLLPIIVIFLLEFVLRGGRPVCIIFPKFISTRNRSWIDAIYNALAVFIFGAAVTQFLTEVGKYSIGRLRPHYLTLCQPDLSKVNCSSGYITASVCTSKDYLELTEARLSFPSGHSSFSMYCMLYLILYIQARVDFQAVLLVKPFLQLILFSMGFFTCLSRVSDYKHHWSDVLAGGILGMGVCVAVVLSLADFGKYLCQSGIICGTQERPSADNQPTLNMSNSNSFASKHEHQINAETSSHSRIINMEQIDSHDP